MNQQEEMNVSDSYMNIWFKLYCEPYNPVVNEVV